MLCRSSPAPRHANHAAMGSPGPRLGLGSVSRPSPIRHVQYLLIVCYISLLFLHLLCFSRGLNAASRGQSLSQFITRPTPPTSRYFVPEKWGKLAFNIPASKLRPGIFSVFTYSDKYREMSFMVWEANLVCESLLMGIHTLLLASLLLPCMLHDATK